MRIFERITARNAEKKTSLWMREKNGEKPKILITESVIIGNHSTVFSVGESPNLKPIRVAFRLGVALGVGGGFRDGVVKF